MCYIWLRMAHVTCFKKHTKLKKNMLGIINEIEKIADKILSEIKWLNYYEHQINYHGKDITIHCYKINKQSTYHGYTIRGYFEPINPNTFKIVFSESNKSTLVHELKHMDWYLRRAGKTDAYWFINHVGRHIIINYEHLFKDKETAQILQRTFYSCNPDEFEAHYHGLWMQIRKMITPEMSTAQRIKIIKDFLNEEEIFILYKAYYKINFNLESFFKTKEDCNFFINEFFYRQETLNKITQFDRLKSLIKSTILNKFIKDKNIDVGVKEFDYYINKTIKSNYKKFFRLYSSF